MLAEKDIQRLLETARAAIVMGHAAGAIEPLRRVLTYEPDHAHAHALLASALRQLKRLEAAYIEANLAIASEPESAFAHIVLAYVLYDKRQPAAAKRHFETARELDPTSAGPLIGLAHVARFEDRDAEALSLLQSALEIEPEEVDAFVALGHLHHARRRFAEAEDAARRALEIEPEHSEALVLMGYVHLSKGDIEAAREHAVWALRANATDPSAIGLLASVKARESLLLGTWYRANAWVTSFGPRMTLILLGMFVFQLFGRLILEDVGLPLGATVVYYAWLAVCVYSWVGPPRFEAMIRKELESVRLRSDY